MKRVSWIPGVLAAAALSVGLSACGSTISSAECNQCLGPSFTAEQCRELGDEAGCETAELVEKTDDACAVGEPPTSYTACRFTDCEEVPACGR